MTDLITPTGGLCSAAFPVSGQITVSSSGLQPGDEVVFDLLTFAALQTGACPCPPLSVEDPAIEAIIPFLCCTGPVRLTAARPLAILDMPQGAFFRACLRNNTDAGVELTTQHVWFSNTNLNPVPDFLRGCPDECCDGTAAWRDTGQVRCVLCEGGSFEDENGDTVSCGGGGGGGGSGGRVMVQIGDPGETVLYGFAECPLSDLEDVTSPCYAIVVDANEDFVGWTRVSAESGVDALIPPGCTLPECDFDGFGDCPCLRIPSDVTFAAPSGDIPPLTGGGGSGSGATFNYIVQYEQTNKCGDYRWASRRLATWLDTGARRCTANGTVLEGQYTTDTCNITAWFPTEEPVVWTATGQIRCTATNVERQEVNQCGTLRWTVGEPVTLVDTGNRRCLDGFYDAQYQNQCGTTVWEHIEPEEWSATGQTGCNVSNKVTVQETNQCGQLRWVTTNEDCGTGLDPSTHTATIVGAPSIAPEGTTFTFTVSLDAPATVNALPLSIALSGDEQTAHSYSSPRSVIIPVGSMSNGFAVTTVNDAAGGPNTTLTATIQPHARLTGIGSPASVTLTPTAVPNSSHDIVSLVGTPASAPEGSTFTFTATLDTPVSGSTLTLSIALSGDEQTAHSYASPRSVTIPVGSVSGSFTVATINDAAGGPDTTLTATIQPHPRLTGTGSPASVTLTAVAVPDSTHTILSLVVDPVSGVEGTEFCWTATLNAAVAGSPLTLAPVLSGSEQTAHSYSAPSIIIPVGSNSGTGCITTIDDNVGGADTQLCLAISPGGRITSGHAAVCATVTQHSPPGGVIVDPPTFSGGTDGFCYAFVRPTEAGAEQYIRFKTDGTWVIRGTAPGHDVPFESGSWITGAFDASDYELRMTGTRIEETYTSGSPACGAPYTSVSTPISFGWTAITGPITFSADSYAAIVGLCSKNVIVTLNMTIEIREIANPANGVSAPVLVCAETAVGEAP